MPARLHAVAALIASASFPPGTVIHIDVTPEGVNAGAFLPDGSELGPVRAQAATG